MNHADSSPCRYRVLPQFSSSGCSCTDGLLKRNAASPAKPERKALLSMPARPKQARTAAESAAEKIP